MSFFPKLSTKLTPSSENCSTKCNVDFTRKMTLLPKVSLKKMIFWIEITTFQQMIFDTLLMYLHTKSHIFLKIGIFYKKEITFSSSAHLMKKSTFLPKFQFFFAQNWHFCTKIDIDRNTCHFASKFARHYSITELRNSLICQKLTLFA